MSRSTNGENLYLADKAKGIFRSQDMGFSWHSIYKFAFDEHCFQVISVNNESGECFWTITGIDENYKKRYNHTDNPETQKMQGYRICSYNMYIHDDGRMTLKFHNIPLENINIDIGPKNKLMYDGKMSVFLVDSVKTIHEFSLFGEYLRKLSLPNKILDEPGKLAIDSNNQLLSIGLKGKVKLLPQKQNLEHL